MMRANTVPELLRRNYEKYGNGKVAMRQKGKGIWKRYSWEDYYLHVKHFSLGLISLGLKQGQAVMIIGDNCPEFYWAELAVHCANAISVIVFAEIPAKVMEEIIDDAGVIFIVAQDQEIVDKILSIKNEIPQVRNVIYWEPDRLRFYGDSWLLGFSEVEEMGKGYDVSHQDLFERNLDGSKPDEVCIISYASEKTELPVGVVVTHDNLIKGMRAFLSLETWYPTDEYFSFMTIASFWEQNLGITGSLLTGVKVNFAESLDTAQRDLREIAPHIVQCPSSVWQELAARVQERMSGSGFFSRLIFRLLLPTRSRAAMLVSAGQKPGIFQRVVWWIGHFLLFKQLLDKLGFVRARLIYTDGNPMEDDAFNLLQAFGISIRHLYGTPETQINAIHRKGDVRNGTVGKAIPGCKIKVSEGEILLKGATPNSGYYQKRDLTISKVSQDGWFNTGERGDMTSDRHLVCLSKGGIRNG